MSFARKKYLLATRTSRRGPAFAGVDNASRNERLRCEYFPGAHYIIGRTTPITSAVDSRDPTICMQSRAFNTIPYSLRFRGRCSVYATDAGYTYLFEQRISIESSHEYIFI